MQERFRFRHVHAITGTLVLAAVGVLIVVLVFAGRSQRWLIGNVTLRIVLPETGAAGIRQGSEVYLLGMLAGTVSGVRVNPAGGIEARATIRRDFFRFVRADSAAVVKKKFGVAGDSFFEITRGKGQPLSEKDAFIVCNEPSPGALESAVDEMRGEALISLKKFSAGLDTWTVLGSNLITSDARLDELLVHADNIVTEIQQGKGTAGKLLTDPAIAEELQTVLAKANRSLDEAQVTLSNLQMASGNLQLASTNLPAISGALNNEAKDLPGLVLQTQVAMRELERLIEAIQRQWLIRKYVNRTNPPPLRPLPSSGQAPKEPVKPLRSPKGSAR